MKVRPYNFECVRNSTHTGNVPTKLIWMRAIEWESGVYSWGCTRRVKMYRRTAWISSKNETCAVWEKKRLDDVVNLITSAIWFRAIINEMKYSRSCRLLDKSMIVQCYVPKPCKIRRKCHCMWLLPVLYATFFLPPFLFVVFIL